MFFSNFKCLPSWIMQKTFDHHLSPNYWSCGGEFAKLCKLFVKCWTLSSTKPNSTGTKVCAALHSMALEPFSANWQGKYCTVKRWTLYSATYIGANIMFLQIDKRYTPFSALHQFFPTLLTIWAQVAARHFLWNPKSWPFKTKKECPAPQH